MPSLGYTTPRFPTLAPPQGVHVEQESKRVEGMTEDQLRKDMAADVPAWAKPRKFQPIATGSRIDGISDKIMAWVKENPDETNFAIAKAVGHTKGAVGDRLRKMVVDGRLSRYQKRQGGSWFYRIKEAE